MGKEITLEDMEQGMNDLVAETDFDEAMSLIQKKDYISAKRVLDNTDQNTAEAIRESLSAEDFNNLMSV